MTQFPCQASVLLGALLSDVENRFHTKQMRRTWLTKIKAVAQDAPGGSVTAWILPDGAGVQFNNPPKLSDMKEAAKQLAWYMSGEIYKATNGQPPTELEIANPVQEMTQEQLAALAADASPVDDAGQAI